MRGVVSFFFSLRCWIEDIYAESIRGFHRETTQAGLKLGFTLFIIREVMFFFAFFWAFFHRRVSPRVELGGKWPPEGILVFEYTGVPLLNTVVLISRGVTVTWAHYVYFIIAHLQVRYIYGDLHGPIPNNYFLFTDAHYAGGKRIKPIIHAFGATVLLGFLFTSCQVLEYAEAFFTIKDGVYGRTFFITTGFHGLHVLVGTLFLICTTLIFSNGVFTFSRHS